jgi:cbb3-type cytochrome oxidase cytochrome c subunit
MNHGPIIFLAAFLALSTSWFGLVLRPAMDIGHLNQTNTVPDKVTYPVSRIGAARQGLDAYRAYGCNYCHSQQVRQTATVCDVELIDAGTNQAAVAETLVRTGVAESAGKATAWLSNLPHKVVVDVERARADEVLKPLVAAGAKVDLLIRPVGPDIHMGWGPRRSVAEDFLYDYPVMPGSVRMGPDLANVGVRQPDENWHLRHLYEPRSEVAKSFMPTYRFLFEKRPRAKGKKLAADAVQWAEASDPEPDYDIIPGPEARALAAYMVSLRGDAVLHEASFKLVASAPVAATNAPGAVATNATPVTATNAPPK